ncbi:MAG TPA: glycosyltransferase 87 family protein [Acidimicrobiales bacterium]|nr:glycosyltransferase 87 family protein [Acidimicrobiales bacterium]
MRSRPWRGAAVVTAVGAAACLGLELRFNHMGGILRGRYPMLGVLGVWWLAFAVAAWALLRLPRRAAVMAVMAGAVVFNLAALTAAPQISDDLYRYSWDGSVQAHGIDPYRYPPNDARVAQLRGPWLWPSPKTCASWGKPPNCTRINREMERTIYPPVAQAWFLVLHTVVPVGTRHKGFQVVHGLVGLGLSALLIVVLQGLGRNPVYAVFWAWSPLAVVETAMDAHVDVLAVLAVVLALWAFERRRPVAGGLLLGAGIAIKLIPGVLLPAGLRRKPVQVVIAAAAVVGASYLPHVLAVGPTVLGYLPGYLKEEKYSEGGRFLLLRLLDLHGTVAEVVAVALLVIIVIVVVLAPLPWRLGGSEDRAAEREPPSPITRARWILVAVFLIVTPVQPWYAELVVAVAALDGRWELLAVAAAPYPLYFGTILDKAKPDFGTISYGIAALVVLGATVLRHPRPAPSPAGLTPHA